MQNRDTLSLFEKLDLAYNQNDESFYDDIRKAFSDRITKDRSILFKEYIYYAFSERGYAHEKSVEFFEWLKKLNVKL